MIYLSRLAKVGAVLLVTGVLLALWAWDRPVMPPATDPGPGPALTDAGVPAAVSNTVPVAESVPPVPEKEPEPAPEPVPEAPPPPAPVNVMQAMTDFLRGMKADTKVAEMDRMAVAFANDTGSSRREKIDVLWRFLSENQATNPPAVKFACDALDFLRPIEVAPEIIRMYGVVSDRGMKIELLEVLESSGVLPTVQVSPDVREAFVRHAPAVQSFFKELLDDPDLEIASRALGGYCTVAPSEAALAALDTITTRWLQKVASGQMTEKDPTHIRVLQQILDSAIATPATQDEIIPMLPRLIRAFPREGLKPFDLFLFDVVRGVSLTDRARAALLPYLEEARPVAGCDSSYCRWVEAKAAIHVPDRGAAIERACFVAGRLRASQNPMEQAGLLVFGGQGLLEQLGPEDRSRLKAGLQSALAGVRDPAQAEFIRTGLAVLAPTN
jgi:hypothetical protein